MDAQNNNDLIKEGFSGKAMVLLTALPREVLTSDSLGVGGAGGRESPMLRGCWLLLGG